MKKHNGFTLIEVLVALVVLSIGLLGIAALHIDGVRTGYSALQRTHAVNLASDMADRIRANPNADYAVAAAGPDPTVDCADTADGEAPRDCTPGEMAAYDVWEWRNALNAATATGLPDGQGQIVSNTATSPVSIIVTISWTDKGTPGSYQLTVQQ